MNTLFETGGNREATTHDWLTPPEILHSLGEFDVDPCASEFQPWRTAKQQFTIHDDGLARPWVGRVWCNPPYGAHGEKFLARCADHGNAMVLIFARTDTRSFQRYCFQCADALLFIAGRLSFRLPGGGRAAPAGSPSVLVAYGQNNVNALESSGISGRIVYLKTLRKEAA